MPAPTIAPMPIAETEKTPIDRGFVAEAATAGVLIGDDPFSRRTG